jgi:hypothetical protein
MDTEKKGTKYRELLVDLGQNFGPKTERYLLLSVGFFLSSFIFIPCILIHNKIAGLKKDDKDLITFYLPVFFGLGLVQILLYLSIPTSYFISVFNINIFLDYAIKALIVYDIYKWLADEKKFTFNIISENKILVPRKTVKGFIVEGIE